MPMIARWMGVTRAGTTCDVPVHNVDLYPTFLDAAGAKTPRGKVLDGESLLGLLKGKERLRREAIFWHFPGYLDRANSGSRDQLFRTRPVTVIRTYRPEALKLSDWICAVDVLFVLSTTVVQLLSSDETSIR